MSAAETRQSSRLLRASVAAVLGALTGLAGLLAMQNETYREGAPVRAAQISAAPGLLLSAVTRDTAVCAPVLPLAEGEAAPPVVIYVQKSIRRLGLYRAGVLAVQPSGAPGCFPVGLGFAPEGTKRREGDGRTPEGRYTIFHKNPDSQYHLSLGVSYPGPDDAQAGFDAGIIDSATLARIRKNPSWPPQNTPMGGAIYIHGGGGSMDWTLGCVAVDNAAMDSLFSEGRAGMPVWIVP
jgi:L,D-transpeptidase catalytic domain